MQICTGQPRLKNYVCATDICQFNYYLCKIILTNESCHQNITKQGTKKIINPCNVPLKITEFEHRTLTHCAKSNYLNVLLDMVNFNPLI